MALWRIIQPLELSWGYYCFMPGKPFCSIGNPGRPYPRLVNKTLPLYKTTYFSKGCPKKLNQVWDIWEDTPSTNVDPKLLLELLWLRSGFMVTLVPLPILLYTVVWGKSWESGSPIQLSVCPGCLASLAYCDWAHLVEECTFVKLVVLVIQFGYASPMYSNEHKNRLGFIF